MSTVHQSLPSIPVLAQCGRAIDMSFDYREKSSGQTRHVVQKAVQFLFTDAEGVPNNVGTALPVQGWDLDINQFVGKAVRFFVSEFALSRDGVCVFRFCGFDFDVAPARGRELKQ